MSFSKLLKIWAMQFRAPFLLLAVMLVLVGGAAAFHDHGFHALRFILALIGVTLAHASVNLFNEYSDFKTGIDSRTRRTPFSGGSGNLQAGSTTPGQVRLAAILTLLIALGFGIYLSWVSNWKLLGFIVVGGLVVVFYTTHLARWGLGEFFAGLCLGTFVVLGTYYSQAGVLTSSIVWLSIPPGIWTSLLLLLNEFPDVEADRLGGRKHLLILFGWKVSAIIYTLALAASYLVLVLGMVLGVLPATVALAGLTLPLAFKAASTALPYGNQFEKMLPALGANVGVVLGTNLLLATALLLTAR